MPFKNHAKIIGMVHPCGSGAFGYFEATQDVTHLTKASCSCDRYFQANSRDQANFLSGKGVRTPIFMRFSTVTLGREYPDLCRNPRGFAIKFYTGEGNYDIVGLNWVNDHLSIYHSLLCLTKSSPFSFAATRFRALM